MQREVPILEGMAGHGRGWRQGGKEWQGGGDPEPGLSEAGRESFARLSQDSIGEARHDDFRAAARVGGYEAGLHAHDRRVSALQAGAEGPYGSDSTPHSP